MSGICRLFGVSRQSYYKHDDGLLLRRLAREEFVVQFVEEVRQLDPGIGGKKLWLMYHQRFGDEYAVGRDCFYDILDTHGLKVRRRMRKPRTTDSTHGLPTFPNLVKNYIPEAKNRLWVSDITYIPIYPNPDNMEEYSFCYLSLLQDAYTKEVIGYSVGDTLEAKYPLEALRMGLKHLSGDNEGLIHHSDRGCQYASYAYVGMLNRNGISVSMTESGDPKENAMAERINSTIKNELLKGMFFTSIAEVRRAVKLAIEFYNNHRPHMSINMMTPKQAADCKGEIKKMWNSKREQAIKQARI